MKGFTLHWLLAYVLVVAVNASGQEAAEDRGLIIPVPEQMKIDAATWQRINSRYTKEKQQFMALLLQLDRNQIDYASDSLSDIQHKRQKVSKSLGVNSRAVVNGMTDPELDIDYLRIGWETVPRLTGRVIKVGKNQAAQKLEEVLPKLQTGDTVRLSGGAHVLNPPQDWKVPSDIAIVGAGPERLFGSDTGSHPELLLSGLWNSWQRLRPGRGPAY